MNIHDLSDKTLYPSFHKFHASAAISIYSNVTIMPGDWIKINGDILNLGTNKNMKGAAQDTPNAETNYCEFTLRRSPIRQRLTHK